MLEQKWIGQANVSTVTGKRGTAARIRVNKADRAHISQVRWRKF